MLTAPSLRQSDLYDILRAPVPEDRSAGMFKAHRRVFTDDARRGVALTATPPRPASTGGNDD